MSRPEETTGHGSSTWRAARGTAAALSTVPGYFNREQNYEKRNMLTDLLHVRGNGVWSCTKREGLRAMPFGVLSSM